MDAFKGLVLDKDVFATLPKEFIETTIKSSSFFKSKFKSTDEDPVFDKYRSYFSFDEQPEIIKLKTVKVK